MNDLKTAPDLSAAAIPFKVRLDPYLIESICELARVIREKASTQTDVSGLLYGSAERGARVVAALKTFRDAGPRSDLARRERLEKAYIAAVEEANEDPELSSLQLVGWFSFRNGSGLLSSDVVFHNQHFRKPEDLAIVIWREDTAQITTEVYSKSGLTPMTSTEYRWSSVRLSSEIRHMSEPIDLAMRVKLSDDSFLRAYDTESEEPESGLDSWAKRAGAKFAGVFGFLRIRSKEELNSSRVRGLISDGRPLNENWNLPPAQTEDEGLSDAHVFDKEWRHFEPAEAKRRTAPIEPEPEPSRPAAAAAAAGAVFGAPKTAPQRFTETRPFSEARPYSDLPPVPVLDLGRIGQTPHRRRVAAYAQGEVGGLPMVITPPAKKQFAWHWAVVIFIVCSAVVFAALAFTGLQGGNGRLAQTIASLFSGSELNMRVKSEDDRLRLSWNPRNPAVSSATEGTLQIMDGVQRRTIHLEGRQVADGSVLYRPLTNDVTFRLEVHGEQGSTMGSLRVLDGPQGRQSPVLDVSDPAGTSSQPADAASNPAGIPTSPDGQAPYLSPSPSSQRSALTDPLATPHNGAATPDEVTVPVPIPRSGVSRSNTGPLSAESTLTAARASGSNRFGVAASPDRTVQNTSIPSDAAGSRGSLPSSRNPAYAGASTINGWEATPDPKNKKRPYTPPLAVAAGTGSDFVAPQPLLQVTPNTRSLPNGSVQTPTRVEVQVRVDQTGHVAYARVLNAANIKRTLSVAAVNAARQWTFEPATLRGQRVDSDHTIVFEFRPQR